MSLKKLGEGTLVSSITRIMTEEEKKEDGEESNSEKPSEG